MVKRVLAALSAAALSVVFTGGAARATVPEWHLVRLNDKTSLLNCRERPSTRSRVVGTIREGTALELQAYDGKFSLVTRSTSGGNGAGVSNCYVSTIFVAPVDAERLFGIIYSGRYEITASGLNCRKYPGPTAPAVGAPIRRGVTLRVGEVGFDNRGQSWLRTDRGCYVVGDPAYLQWRGFGEDPNTMCDYIKDEC